MIRVFFLTVATMTPLVTIILWVFSRDIAPEKTFLDCAVFSVELTTFMTAMHIAIDKIESKEKSK